MTKRLPILVFFFCLFVAFIGLSPALYAQIEIPALSDSTTSLSHIPLGFDTLLTQNASGSLATLSSNELNQGINNHPLAAIQGRMAGLFIASVHGNPNGPINVYLRGKSSLFNSNGPLYVVDGVPGAPIDQIAVEDIEQITLLKEPSQTGIYGSLAGNGVLLITTKRGRLGKPRVNYHGYTGVAYAAGQPSVLNADEYRAAVVKFNRQDQFQDMGANTDWFREVTRTALAHNHQLSVGGGFGSTTYRLSGGYFNQQGVVKKTDLERLSARLNVDTRLLKDKLLLNASLSVMSAERNDLPDRLFQTVAMTLPTDPVHNSDGSYYMGAGGFYQNPVAQVDWNQNLSQQKQWLGLLRAQYMILPGLSVGVGYSIKAFDQDAQRVKRPFTIDNIDLTLDSVRRKEYWLNASTQYQLEWKKSSLKVQFDFIRQESQTREAWSASSTSSGRVLSYSGGRSSSTTLTDTYVGQLAYDWSDRWFFNINMASHNFLDLADKTYRIFLPAATIAWDVGAGGGWEDQSFLNHLKWQLNAGKSTTTAPPFNRIIIVGNSIDSKLTWPSVESYGTGIDFRAFRNKISGSLEWYSRKSQQEQAYPSSNPGRPFYILYSIQNRGLELSLRAPIVTKNHFKWEASFVGATNKSKLLDANFAQLPLSVAAGQQVVIQVKQHESAGSIAGMIVDKIVNGEPRYTMNPNGDPTYATLGNIDPAFFGTLSNTFQMNKIDISLVLVGVTGNKVYQMQRNILASSAAVPRNNISAEAFQFNPFVYLPVSSLFVENGSFVRLDNFSVGYTFVREGKIFQKARVYLAGRNLFTLTSYRGVDPQEGNLGVSDFDSFYPASRSFNLGMNLTF